VTTATKSVPVFDNPDDVADVVNAHYKTEPIEAGVIPDWLADRLRRREAGGKLGPADDINQLLHRAAEWAGDGDSFWMYEWGAITTPRGQVFVVESTEADLRAITRFARLIRVPHGCVTLGGQAHLYAGCTFRIVFHDPEAVGACVEG
jgi:hypothetical protein